MLCLFAQSSPTLCNCMDYSPSGSSVHGCSPGKNTGVGYHVLLQGIFATQGLNPGLLHCSQIVYYLSHQGSLRILECVTYPFSRGSTRPRNTHDILHFTGIHMKPQKTSNSQSNLEKKRTKLEVSCSLTSDHTTKLQSSI